MKTPLLTLMWTARSTPFPHARTTRPTPQGLWVPSPLGPNLDWAPTSEISSRQWSYEFVFLSPSACTKPSWSRNTAAHACANIK